jgi:UDP-N-acetylmuramyl pentapeptide phosphotransferase/UDP-N-acetylglucosamine-1-phosphate transferase
VALLCCGAVIVGSTEAGWRLGLALAGIGLVATVGWVDDRRSLAIGPRLLAHLVSAAAVLPLAVTLPVAGGLATGLGLLWWLFWGVSAINVVNFMDGIDGLIGLQLVILGIHFAVLGGESAGNLLFAAALSGSALGFLWWNWAPARIFLGDSGSGALGLAAVVGGLLVLAGGRAGLVATFLPLFPIFLDATLTMIARARRGERLTEAHRSHLYQRLANGGWGHARVSVAYGLAAALAIPAAATPQFRTTAVTTYLVVVTLAWLRLSRAAASVSVRNGNR